MGLDIKEHGGRGFERCISHQHLHNCYEVCSKEDNAKHCGVQQPEVETVYDSTVVDTFIDARSDAPSE